MCSILLVEDHRDTRRAFAVLLENWGHEVSTSASVAGALAFLDRNDVDVILSDIGLPDQDGCDFISQVRQSNSQVIAIAVSAYFTAADRQRAHEAGFSMYFSKPIDLTELEFVLVQVNAHLRRNASGVAGGSTSVAPRSAEESRTVEKRKLFA